jgi:hypothetical protein
MSPGKRLMAQGVKSEARSSQMLIVLWEELETRFDWQRRNAQHPLQSSKVLPASYGMPVHDKRKVRESEKTSKY